MAHESHPQPEPTGQAAAAQTVDHQLLFEESPDILLVLLPDVPRFTMVAATNARLKVTHTTRATLGRGLFEIFPDNPADPTATGTSNLRASLDRVLHTRRPDTMAVQKYDIRGPDGTYEARYWSPKNLPVLSPSGEVLYILHRVEDVTDLVRASEIGEALRDRTSEMEREVIRRSNELAIAVRELREANSKLAELDAAKTAFFSNISHEFRTPLTLMLGPLEDELAESVQPLPEARRQRLETAHRNSLRLLRLVNSLLEFARIEAGRVQALYQPTDLAALTTELASHFRSAVERAGLTLTVECPPLPRPIYVDREMWEKIVLNLLSNAFKHTFKGGLTVRLAPLEHSVQLTVEDSGVGIAPAELPRLFERFHRVEGTASRTHEGTGIGLSLVRELVTLHSGQIWVESEPGRGSRFHVSVPDGTAHLSPDKIRSAIAPALTGGDTASAYVQEALQWLPESRDQHTLTSPDMGPHALMPHVPTPHDPAAEKALSPPPGVQHDSRPRVLWAEDNADMREYVTRLLGTDYDVISVPDGQAALELARTNPPDLVLSDVMMPRLDGIGLLKELRADDRTRRLPVILLSARAGEESSIHGLEAGADDYLMKPFTARELLARVRTHVQLASQRRAWEKELEDKIRDRTAALAASVDRLSLLDHITRAVAERQDLESIIRVVVHNVEESLPVDVCWIGSKGDLQGFEITSGLTYEPDITRPLPPVLAEKSVRAVVTAPLRAAGAIVGLLVAARREPNSFSSGECEFLRQLSEHVALAAHQADLHASLQAAYDDLRQTQQAVLQQERLSALGQMASGIAHDINNAISPVTLYVENLLESDPDLSPRGKQYLPIILRAIDDVSATVARMREFYRPRDAQLTLVPVELNHLVEQVIELTRARWSDMPQKRGVVIEMIGNFAENLPRVPGVESEIREALTNLVFNGVDAMPEGGKLTLATSASEQGVRLEVADTGVGMDEATRRKCFEPFFTTKGERGTGLGLAMVHGAVRRHAADISIDSTPGKGTRFVITFPISQAPEIAGQNGDATPPSVPPLRILVIDDDPLVLAVLEATLKVDGHTVATAEDPRLGVELFRAAHATNPFNVVMTDLGMPHLDGRAVARAVKQTSPTTPVILLTGWGRRLDAEGQAPQDIDQILAKPPKLRELRAALAQRAS